jgi:hypothetical protein
VEKYVNKHGKSPAKVLAVWPENENAPRVARLLQQGHSKVHYVICVALRDGAGKQGQTVYWGVEYFRMLRKGHAWAVWEAFKETLIGEEF